MKFNLFLDGNYIVVVMAEDESPLDDFRWIGELEGSVKQCEDIANLIQVAVDMCLEPEEQSKLFGNPDRSLN